MPAKGQATGRKLWKAGELARETGLTRQALHQYVLAGLLVPADLTKGGQRLFDKDAVGRVELIRKVNLISGYPLRECRDIFLKNKH
jgi:DNA-binding transcriptional MerR regulator